MKSQSVKSNMILLMAAAIWGFAFVAQRVGAQFLGAFTFNGVRFLLGSISLLPLILLSRKNEKNITTGGKPSQNAVIPGIIAGCILFLAASLQQIGLEETTAGKAAFITGLYIIFVPLFGIFLKHRIHLNTWLGGAAAIIGLYVLSVTESLSIAKGDLYELIGAFLWAIHILVIDHFSTRIDALKLSAVQFVTCSILSLSAAAVFETISLQALNQALIPILYGGICSVGIAYTLQVIGQKHAKPSHAAIVLSMEAVFASIGGFLLLQENLGVRGYVGCAMMLFGMLLSQLQFPKKQ